MQRPVLKQINDLTVRDLMRHPVWMCIHGLDENKPWYSETDELTYRPWDGALPYNRSDPDAEIVVARTRFTFADASSYFGLLTPPYTTGNRVSRMQPALFLTDGTAVSFYKADRGLAEKTLGNLLRRITKERSRVFPVRYEVSDQVVIPPVSGELVGVYYMGPVGSRNIRVL